VRLVRSNFLNKYFVLKLAKYISTYYIYDSLYILYSLKIIKNSLFLSADRYKTGTIESLFKEESGSGNEKCSTNIFYS
jgi:hypothetical protein